MAIYTTTKTKFFIGTTAEKSDVTGYEADTWVEVKELENIGEFGDEAEEISFSTIDDGRVRKIKGIRDAGTMEITVARDPADAGQTKMREAANTDLDFNFKVVLNDKPTPTGTPTIYYLRGAVLSQRVVIGDGKNVIKQNFKVSVNREPLEDPATA